MPDSASPAVRDPETHGPGEPGGDGPDERSTDSADLGERAPRRIWSHLPIVVTLVVGILLVVGTIGPPLFGRGVFLASDAITQAYPWRAYDDPAAENVAHHGPIGDTIDGGFPTRASFFDALREGEFLAWTPYTSGGKALGSESANGVLDPFAFPSYLMAPDWFAPALIKLATMAAAIGFTFLFCRRLQCDHAPALFAGLAFAGSGFMVMWTNWSQPEVAALVPALFWSTERFLQRPRVSTALPMMLALAGMLLGFFPSLVFYALYILGPYVLVRVACLRREQLRRRIGTLVGAGAAIGAGIGLVGATLLPFALTLGDTATGDRAEHAGNHLHLPTLLTAVAPKAFGLSSEGPSEAYFGELNQIETIAFVGATTAVLAVLGIALPLRRSTPRGARAVLVAATVLIGWATFVGGDLLRLLQHLPAFENSFVGRTRSVLGFMVAVLAAFGLQAIVDRRWPAGRRQWAWAVCVVGVTAVVAAVVGRRALDFARDAGRAHVLRGGLILPVVIGSLAIAAIALAHVGGRRLATVALACLPVLLIVESLDLSLPLLPNEDRASVFPTTPGIEYLEEALGDDGRMAPEGLVFFGSGSAYYRLRSVTGHAFYSDEWKEAVHAIDPTAFRFSPTFPRLTGTPEVMASPLLDRMGAAWFVGSAQTPPPGDRVGTAASDSTCTRTVDLTDELRVTVPMKAGARALVVRVCDAARLAHGTAVVATLEGGGVTGRAHLPVDLGAGELAIALPAEDVHASRVAVNLSVEGGDRRALTLAASGNESAVVDVVRPADDGLRLVYADDLRIYERTRALDRIHWAGRAEVVADEEERLDRLASGEVPPGTVLLNEAGPEGSGRSARVTVTGDTASRITVAVDAADDGYVVVADNVQREWYATVDGETVDLVAADHVGGAVYVPAGRHEVTVRYRPTGQRAGLALSGFTIVVVAGALVWEARRRRRSTAVPLTQDAGPAAVGDR